MTAIFGQILRSFNIAHSEALNMMSIKRDGLFLFNNNQNRRIGYLIGQDILKYEKEKSYYDNNKNKQEKTDVKWIKQVRSPIIIICSETEKLLDISKIIYGSGHNQAHAVYHILEEWNLNDEVQTISCDAQLQIQGNIKEPVLYWNN